MVQSAIEEFEVLNKEKDEILKKEREEQDEILKKEKEEQDEELDKVCIYNF